MLDGFFQPSSVAVVGAAREPGKVGHFVFRNLLDAGFEGPVYPINPKADEIQGHRAYASLADAPPVDLAVIVVPAAAVPQVISECAVVGTHAAIVISAGFTEAGPAGAALERELLERAKEGGVRVLGPNCLGLISSASRLNASFAAGFPPAGHVAFMSQSGALGTAILDYARGEGIGLSHFVSLGNKADITETDLLRVWHVDPNTSVIAAYLESVSAGPAFVEAARAVTRDKPVIVLKSGVSDAGARAVSSHTGSLAGSDAAYDAAFHAAGIVRAESVQHLFDLAAGLSAQPVPSGPGVAILTNAGGPAVMATDACDALGLSLASLEGETIDRLRELLPQHAAVYNPIDILGDAGPERYARSLEVLLEDPNVRAIVAILTPQAMTSPTETAHLITEAAAGSQVTVLGCFMGRDSVSEAWAVLRDGGIPNYPFPERAAATLAEMMEYGVARSRVHAEPDVTGDGTDRVRTAVAEARDAGLTFLTEQRAAECVEAYGLTVPRGSVASDLDAARSVASEVGYPVALKIASPDILHKSDIGGIRLGIADEDELAEAYDAVLGRARSYAPDALIDGVLVQEMVPSGREVIIGVDRDSQFGPLLMLGLGGVFVEVMKDVAFRLAPVTPAEARSMLEELRSYGLLRGARGQRPADIDAIVEAACAVSRLAADVEQIVELDINPLIVGNTGEGAIAADVRIGIGGTP